MDFEYRLTLFDTLILCRFYRDYYLWEELEKILEYVTGLSLDKAALQETASRVSDLVRWFNIREGLTAADDTLPKRFFREKVEGGRGITEEELLLMRRDYYRLRRWSDDGKPLRPPPVPIL
jgi:aldehyde:ferredoxin oxidoreductase